MGDQNPRSRRSQGHHGLPAGYGITRGAPLDRLDQGLLQQLMTATYAELTPDPSPDPPAQTITQTINSHLSSETPLWWAWATGSPENPTPSMPVGVLWVGNAVDQRRGDRHAYILLLYVAPDHRRRGLATALLHQAHQWAEARGDTQIALQVFSTNGPALRLYEKLGYVPQSVLMTKPLVPI